LPEAPDLAVLADHAIEELLTLSEAMGILLQRP
jgi:hypothetical protein